MNGIHNGNIKGVTETNPTSATRYNPIFINTGNNASVATTEYMRRTNMDYNIYMLQGTEDALGYVYLELGNTTKSGAAGNKFGALRLYNTDDTYAVLRANNISSYGGFRVSGKKGGYHGILLGDETSAMAVMSQDAEYQGLYNQAKSKWIIQYHGTNNAVGINGSHSASYGITLNGTVQATSTLTFTNSTVANHKITTSSGAMYYSSASTVYIDSGADSSIIFRPEGTEKARFDASTD
jgi:hypothetical protein